MPAQAHLLTDHSAQVGCMTCESCASAWGQRDQLLGVIVRDFERHVSSTIEHPQVAVQIAGSGVDCGA